MTAGPQAGGTRTDGRAEITEALALAAVLLAIATPSIWARLYFTNNTAGFLAAVFGAAWVALLATAVSVGAVLRQYGPTGILRALTCGAVVLWGGVIANGSMPGTMPAWLLAVGAIVAALSSLRWAGTAAPAWWPRARASMASAAVIFFLSSPLLGWIRSEQLSLLPPDTRAGRVPTLWLLLDESSAGTSDLLIRPLRERGLAVAAGSLRAAGMNTLDIVPSIVSRTPLGATTAPCSPTAVCSKDRSVDFARVAPGRTGLDIVGFHHPYCAMSGLRSCSTDTRQIASWAVQWEQMACSAAQRIQRDSSCTRSSIERQLAVREKSIESISKAPFWNEGGDLYAHILLPHLPASAAKESSVATAYGRNVEAAAVLVGTLAARLQQRFPDFRLVVFSDHGLRPMDQCGAQYSHNCERAPEYADRDHVPLIVASPKPLSLTLPETNAHVLDLKLY